VLKKLDRMREKVTILPIPHTFQRWHDAGWKPGRTELERDGGIRCGARARGEVFRRLEEIPVGLRISSDATI